jgi:uncharacterized paraquat-inducible protein A
VAMVILLLSAMERLEDRTMKMCKSCGTLNMEEMPCCTKCGMPLRELDSGDFTDILGTGIGIIIAIVVALMFVKC